MTKFSNLHIYAHNISLFVLESRIVVSEEIASVSRLLRPMDKEHEKKQRHDIIIHNICTFFHFFFAEKQHKTQVFYSLWSLML